MLFSYRESLKTSSDCGLVYPRMQFEIEIACYKKRRMNDVVSGAHNHRFILSVHGLHVLSFVTVIVYMLPTK